MDYILTLNEKINSYKEAFDQEINLIKTILKEVDFLHRNIYKNDKNIPEINGSINLIYNIFVELNNLRNILAVKETEFNDLNIRTKIDFPDYQESDLVNIDDYKKNHSIEDIAKYRVIVCKLYESLKLINLLLTEEELNNLDNNYLQLIDQLKDMSSNILDDLSTEEEKNYFSNNFIVDRNYNEENIYLLEPITTIVEKAIVKEDIKEEPEK